MTIAIYQHATNPNYSVGGFTFVNGWLTLQSETLQEAFLTVLDGLGAEDRANITQFFNPVDDSLGIRLITDDTELPVLNSFQLNGQPDTFYLNSSNQNAGTLPAARLPAFTGDVAGALGVITLNTVNPNVGTFGSATQVPVVTVNGKGLVTGVTLATIAPLFSSIASKPTTRAGYGITDAASNESQVFSGTISATNLSGTNTGDQTTITGNAGSATILATGRTIGITGDITYTSPVFNGSANVTGVGTLATVNGNVGTFGSTSAVPIITVNAKGLVTSVTTAALGTLATQDGTFSGTSSGINTGDQTTITGNAGSATALETSRTISITGDGTWTSGAFNGTANVTGALTLATVNANVGTFGSTSQVPIITVNAKGLVTAVSTAALGTLATQNGTFSGTSSGTNTGDQTTITGNAGSATILETGRTIALTGDVTYTSPAFNGSANVTAVATLATVNSNVGLFGSTTAVPIITVNGKGLVTAVSTAALGTAAVKNTGTSGDSVALTNGVNVWSGAQRINTIFTIGSAAGVDASFVINESYGAFDRLTQWSTTGTSRPALNIMAAKSSGGTDSWCAWGVDAAGNWRINQGISFNGTGLTIGGSTAYWFTESALDAVSFLPFQVKGGISIDTNTTASTTCMSFFNGQGSGTRVGWIGTNGSSTSFNTSSDARLKEHIEDASDSGDVIDLIQVRQFDWRINGVHEPFGLVTQELLSVVPQIVSLGPTEDDMQAADFSKLVPLTVKELQMIRRRETIRDAQIDALLARIVTLEAQVSALS